VGANLTRALLQGTSLYEAQLQGTYFDGTELQGADLSRANVADAEFGSVFVFRASIENTDLSTSIITYVYADRVAETGAGGEAEPFGRSQVDSWIAAATEFRVRENRAGIAARFDRLNLDFQKPDLDARDHKTWWDLIDADKMRDPDGAKHRQRLATVLANLACQPEDAPYGARGLIHRGSDRLAELRDKFAHFRARLEEGRTTLEKCPGVAGFTADDWHQLDAIIPNDGPPDDHSDH
jgi:hypothetical protein